MQERRQRNQYVARDRRMTASKPTEPDDDPINIANIAAGMAIAESLSDTSSFAPDTSSGGTDGGFGGFDGGSSGGGGASGDW